MRMGSLEIFALTVSIKQGFQNFRKYNRLVNISTLKMTCMLKEEDV